MMVMNDDLFSPEVSEDTSFNRRRRLDYNIAQQNVVRGWTDKNGITMKVTNNGHHWHFRKLHDGHDKLPKYKQKTTQADWWPSTARFVLQRRYGNDLKVVDHEHLIELLDEHFNEGRSMEVGEHPEAGSSPAPSTISCNLDEVKNV